MRDDERKAARELLDRVGMTLDPRAVRELETLDYRVPLTARRHPVGPTDLVICSVLAFPLTLPDNAIGACAECPELIQYRPYLSGSGATLVCAPCGLRRVRGDA